MSTETCNHHYDRQLIVDGSNIQIMYLTFEEFKPIIGDKTTIIDYTECFTIKEYNEDLFEYLLRKEYIAKCVECDAILHHNNVNAMKTEKGEILWAYTVPTPRGSELVFDPFRTPSIIYVVLTNTNHLENIEELKEIGFSEAEANELIKKDVFSRAKVGYRVFDDEIVTLQIGSKTYYCYLKEE